MSPCSCRSIENPLSWSDLQELFWLLMFIGYLISDADDSERPLVPAAILEVSSLYPKYDCFCASFQVYFGSMKAKLLVRKWALPPWPKPWTRFFVSLTTSGVGSSLPKLARA